jgi:hypothetical protein
MAAVPLASDAGVLDGGALDAPRGRDASSTPGRGLNILLVTCDQMRHPSMMPASVSLPRARGPRRSRDLLREAPDHRGAVHALSLGDLHGSARAAHGDDRQHQLPLRREPLTEHPDARATPSAPRATTRRTRASGTSRRSTTRAVASRRRPTRSSPTASPTTTTAATSTASPRAASATTATRPPRPHAGSASARPPSIDRGSSRSTS